MSKVFISYSHKDEAWKDRVVTHLSVLAQDAKLQLWDDRRITAGSDWLPQIENAIRSCDIALLLISADFLTSNFILRQEIPKLLQRRVNDGLRVMPIILRPCAWTQVSWLRGIQARPKDGQPLTSLSENDAEEALTALVVEAQIVAEAETRGPLFLTLPNRRMVVWLMGSHRTLPAKEQQKALQACRVIARACAKHRIQLVMGTSRMLEYLADNYADFVENPEGLANSPGEPWRKQIAEEHAQQEIPCPNPIVLLGNLGNRGVREIFSDSIGSIPDIAIMIGGRLPEESGRAWEEQRLAVAAKIPFLPLKFTGGAAALAKDTLHVKLKAKVRLLQTLGGNMERLGHLLIEIIQEQGNLTFRPTIKPRTKSPTKSLPPKVETALQAHRKNQQRRIANFSRSQWNLFKWDLFALPINCEKQSSGRLYGSITKFEDLVLLAERLVLITGAPGSGKTTACFRLMAKPPLDVLALNIGTLKTLSRSSIFEFMSNDVGLKSASLVNRLERTGRLFFIVDGLGERKDADSVARSLRTLTRQFRQSKFIVTCRNSDYVESWLPRFARWNIQILNAESQNDFIRTQPQALQRKFDKAFAADNHFHDILSNQFLLLLAAKLMAEPKTAPIPLTKLGLYTAFLDSFLREWEHVQLGQRDLILRVLQEIAVVMRKGDLLRSYQREQDLAKLINNHLSRQGQCEPSERDVQETLQEIYRHGLLVKEGGLIRFFQETFQEFLCARWLCDQRAFPREFRKQEDKVYFKEVQLNDVILDFYRKMIAESAVFDKRSAYEQIHTVGTSTISGALQTWQEKLDFLQEQEAVIADPAQKFALAKQIHEAKTKIKELGE